jgi:hypothetical protein
MEQEEQFASRKTSNQSQSNNFYEAKAKRGPRWRPKSWIVQGPWWITTAIRQGGLGHWRITTATASVDLDSNPWIAIAAKVLVKSKNFLK